MFCQFLIYDTYCKQQFWVGLVAIMDVIAERRFFVYNLDTNNMQDHNKPIFINRIYKWYNTIFFIIREKN